MHNDEQLQVSDNVEVFCSFKDTWAGGFQVAEVLGGDRYRLRRLSDGAWLPDPTSVTDLRREDQRGR